MKIIKSKISIIIIFTVAVSLFFYLSDYVYNEGFNPTDEGVILSQSFRILNGQIPHKDFISIRPAASGYIHAINFFIPGAVFVNARYFVLFQFFIIATLTSLLFFKILCKKQNSLKSLIYFTALLISSYALSILNYNLYSWTTIDAVFWSIISIYLLFGNKSIVKHSAGLFFISIAALSRQTFALPAFLLFLYIIILYRRNIKSLLIICITGGIPLLLYLLILLKNDALGEFINQMTGRTEFFQTAILQFAKRFLFCISTPINLMAIILSFIIIKKKQRNHKKKYINYILIIYLALTFILILKYFWAKEQNIFTLPFELFFICGTLIFFHYANSPDKKTIRQLSFSILFISWISAISLGDNTPVFATGPLYVSIIALCFDLLDKSSLKNLYKMTFHPITAFSISLVIFISGYFSQQKFNYRDKPANELKSGLGEISKNFGKIKTNNNILQYYSDLNTIFISLPNSKNNTLVFPHNAAFYTAFETKNPFSLDWLIPNEYIGQENRIEKDLKNLLQRENLYFIADKYNVISFSQNKVKQNYEGNTIYEFIKTNLRKIHETEFFVIYSK